MVTFAIGVLCGIAVGCRRGGRVARLTTLRFRAPTLLAVAALTQAGFAVVAPGYRVVALGVAYAVVGIWLTLNAFHHRGGVRLGCVVLVVGWLLNLIPIMLNGGMPVSADALERVGASKSMSVTEGHFSKHVPAGRDTRLSVLGDVIPLPVTASVVSIGDIILLAGIARVVASGTISVAGAPRLEVVPLDATRGASDASTGVLDVLPQEQPSFSQSSS